MFNDIAHKITRFVKKAASDGGAHPQAEHCKRCCQALGAGDGFDLCRDCLRCLAKEQSRYEWEVAG